MKAEALKIKKVENLQMIEDLIVKFFLVCSLRNDEN